MNEDLENMTDQELAADIAKKTTILDQRRAVRDAERTTDDMALAYLQAAGREQGTAFETPTGFIGAYPRGWRVTTSDRRAFEAAAPGVTTPPPDEGCWVEIDPDSPIVPYWNPGAYRKGDQARDAGQIWTATSDVDGARPSEYPGGWTLSD